MKDATNFNPHRRILKRFIEIYETRLTFIRLLITWWFGRIFWWVTTKYYLFFFLFFQSQAPLLGAKKSLCFRWKKLLPQPPTRFTSRCFTSTTGDVMQQNRKSQSCKSAAAVCSEAARLSGCCKELEDVERPEPRSAIVKNKSLDEEDEERETSWGTR